MMVEKRLKMVGFGRKKDGINYCKSVVYTFCHFFWKNIDFLEFLFSDGWKKGKYSRIKDR